ncbi:MAG: transposase [Dehalococcoidia bacterium]|nr:transposase [Dehalococcoidia bacterium]
MPYDPDRHHRQTIRLQEYDYTQPGASFVTVCTHNRGNLFGAVSKGEMRPNAFGKVVEDVWKQLPAHSPNVVLDAFVVMPNDTSRPTDKLRINVTPGSLGAIVRSFKSASTKQINILRNTPGAPVWQRNYYEHVVRTEEDLESTRNYVLGNPAKWDEDPDNLLVGGAHVRAR